MTRRVVRFVTLTVVVAAAVAVARALTTKRDPLPTPPSPSGEPWPPVTTPSEPSEPAGVPVSDGSSWVDPTAAGGCPDGYPVKAKMRSKIFHSPGQLNYERTTPDRCYRDAAAAEADGLRAAKR
ncbi:MAG: hypothetical protein U5K30_08970 [Acidimicrobiales bacterium]|nr:hypothetical protein [Acidimicrobiales bacterium]